MRYNSYQQFLDDHSLSTDYLEMASRHFDPVVAETMDSLETGNLVILGITGCQGSGKSTMAAFLQARLEIEHNLAVANLSLDDFYLTKRERTALARDIHPLLATRGVPGTHDVTLALDTLQALKNTRRETVLVPGFNKAEDDRLPKSGWTPVETPLQVIILEGWCLGARPQPEDELAAPVNELEAREDPEGTWRRWVNQKLATEYPALFQQPDTSIMLRAPSFDCVYRWRFEQEEKLAKKLQEGMGEEDMEQETQGKESSQAQPSQSKRDDETGGEHAGLMGHSRVARFVLYFQRLTQFMLEEMPARVDHLYQLDEKRRIIDERHRSTSKQ